MRSLQWYKRGAAYMRNDTHASQYNYKPYLCNYKFFHNYEHDEVGKCKNHSICKIQLTHIVYDSHSFHKTHLPYTKLRTD